MTYPLSHLVRALLLTMLFLLLAGTALPGVTAEALSATAARTQLKDPDPVKRVAAIERLGEL